MLHCDTLQWIKNCFWTNSRYWLWCMFSVACVSTCQFCGPWSFWMCGHAKSSVCCGKIISWVCNVDIIDCCVVDDMCKSTAIMVCASAPFSCCIEGWESYVWGRFYCNRLPHWCTVNHSSVDLTQCGVTCSEWFLRPRRPLQRKGEFAGCCGAAAA